MLQGSKVLLRNYKESDLASALELKCLAATQMPFNGQSFGTLARFAAHYHQTGFWGGAEGGGRMLICGNDQIILGEISFTETSTHIQTISYMLFRTSDYGKGYATETLRLFSDYLFSTFSNLNRLQLYVHVDNIGSTRVAEKCNFFREGIARETMFIGGRFCDQYLYSLLRKEWRSK